MRRGAHIDGTDARPPRVLRNARGHVHIAKLIDLLRHVGPLVSAHCKAPVTWNLLQHQKRRIEFRPPIGLEQLRVHDLIVTILRQQIALVAHLASFSLPERTQD
jgi:hypothetical protein